MKRLITRRRLIATGITASLSGIALYAANRSGLVPPDHAGLFGIPETLTYAAHRLLFDPNTLAREFDRSMISKNFPVLGTALPENEDYRRYQAKNFEEWRLPVDGLVERPAAFSVADLQRLPLRDQVTLHVCEEGWSAIAEWTGVQLSHVLRAVGVRPEAKFVVFKTYDGWEDSIDMNDAWHAQTLLASGMNGVPVPIQHGGPIRLRVERQCGYKSLKFISSMTLTDNVDHQFKDLGPMGVRYSWYAGI